MEALIWVPLDFSQRTGVIHKPGLMLVDFLLVICSDLIIPRWSPCITVAQCRQFSLNGTTWHWSIHKLVKIIKILSDITLNTNNHNRAKMYPEHYTTNTTSHHAPYHINATIIPLQSFDIWPNTTRNHLQKKTSKQNLILSWHLSLSVIPNNGKSPSASKSAVPHQPTEQTTSRLIPNNQPQLTIHRFGPQIPSTLKLRYADQIMTPWKNSGRDWFLQSFSEVYRIGLSRLGTDGVVVGIRYWIQ